MRQYLETKFREVRKYYPEWAYIAIGIDVDHVHIHMVIPPKYSVSEVVDIIKTNTIGAMKAKFGFLSKIYWDNRGIWGKGFFA